MADSSSLSFDPRELFRYNVPTMTAKVGIAAPPAVAGVTWAVAGQRISRNVAKAKGSNHSVALLSSNKEEQR